MNKIEKYNKLVIGLLLGLLIPVMTFLISWMVKTSDPLIDYMKYFQKINRLSSLVSLSTIPNLLLFYIAIWLNKYKAARGVILATFVMAIIIVILKII